MHPDGTGVRQLTDYHWNRFPRISPDGRSVAYTVFEGYDRHLDVVDIDGRNRRRVLQGDQETVIAMVAWSPDGEQFAVGLQHVGPKRPGRPAPIARPWPAPDRFQARVAVIPKDGGEGSRILPVPPASRIASLDWR
jgi:dipeptidyl aminopeptidase/acylaminoacyl peptidase